MIEQYFHDYKINQTLSLVVYMDSFAMVKVHGIIYQVPLSHIRKATYKEILEYLKVEWDRQFDMISNDQYKEIDSSLKINYIEDAFFIYHLESDIELMKECRD